ncbi:MAG: formate--tetrahydrofolate ligase [Rhizobiales bacterium]|nr:formate--tetrahydrofolate ligase [Hyphomicrobiales bacterium]
MTSDIDIARAARLEPIAAVAAKIDIPETALIPYGRSIAKVDGDFVKSLEGRRDGRLVLVTAISPTPAGEGKTTTTVGLGDALRRIGERATICLREPSLGPVFGMKGGAAGGGRAQVVPMEQINLHFTGDFHAIGAAHNLLTAMIDNRVYWSGAQAIDPRRVSWRRVLDMNDRALRNIVVGLGGAANGFARESGFDITVASEVMAVFCLARDLPDLEARLGRIVVARNADKSPITAADVKAAGAMTVLLKDALQPNLAQTIEGTPAFVHGGPFANIAHGCNSVIATRAALKLSDWTVTEAGFGADLGAEKFLDIKCRIAGLDPDAAVLVATVRALKMHGGVAKEALGQENLAALRKGLSNLDRHVANLKKFGLPVVVALNAFDADTAEEQSVVLNHCRDTLGVPAALCRHWADGGAGAEDLARGLVDLVESGAKRGTFTPLYPGDMPLWEKLRTIAISIYGAADVMADKKIRDQFHELESQGYGRLPICIAKTQYSFSTDPALRGAPNGHLVPVREVRLAAGAGFIVAICGDIMTMPGLPRIPAAETIRIENGRIEGLF